MYYHTVPVNQVESQPKQGQFSFEIVVWIVPMNRRLHTRVDMEILRQGALQENFTSIMICETGRLTTGGNEWK